MDNNSLGIHSLNTSNSVKSLSVSISAASMGGNYWSTRSPLAVTRSSGSKFAIDGFLYYAQGVSVTPAVTHTPSLEQHNDSDNIWTSRASSPVSYAASGSFSLSLGYVGFGAGAVDPDSTSSRAYNESSNSWVSKASGAAPRRNVAGATLNGFGYIIMGNNYQTSTPQNANERYDEILNTWLSRGVTNWAADGIGAFTIDTYLFAIGGRLSSNSSFSSGFMRYDEITNAWFSSFSSFLPSTRSFINSFSANGYGYISGGFSTNTSSYTSMTNELDVSTNVWLQKVSMSVALTGHEGDSFLNGNGYQCGGGNSSGLTETTVQQYRNYGLIKINEPIHYSAKVPTSISILTSVDGSITNLPVQLQSDSVTFRSMISNSSKITRSSDRNVLSAFPANESTGSREYMLKVGLPIRNSWSTAGVWTIRAASATPVALAGGFSTHGFGYLVGGQTTGDAGLSSVQRLNNSIDAWSFVTSISSIRHIISGASLGGLGFAIGGGHPQGSQAFNTVERYVPETNLWSLVTALPLARGASSAFTLNSFMYNFGGGDTSSVVQSTMNQYSDSSNAWTSMTAYPIPIGLSSSGNSAGFGFGTHGSNNSSALTATHIYNDAGNVWITRSSGVTARAGFGNINPSQHNLIACGTNGSYVANGSELNATDEYINSTNIWLARAACPISKRHLSSFSLGKNGYNCGGVSGGTYSSSIQSYSSEIITPELKIDFIINEQYASFTIGFWTSRANNPSGRSGVTSVGIGSKSLTTLGYNGSSVSARTDLYDNVLNAWTNVSNIGAARQLAGQTGFTINGRGFICGGYDGSYYSRVDRFDLAQETWLSMSAFPVTIASHGSFPIVNSGYVCGGANASVSRFTTTYKYDESLDSWSSHAALPIGNAYMTSFSINDVGYLTHGYATNISVITWEYNALTDVWTTLANANVTRSETAGFSIYDRGFSFGGYTGGLTAAMEEYITGSNVWMTRSNNSTARRQSGGSNINGHGFIACGYTGARSAQFDRYNIP